LKNSKITYRAANFLIAFAFGLILIMLPMQVVSQSDFTQIDSLLSGKSSEEQIDLLNEKALNLRNSNPSESKNLAKKALEISNRKGDTNNIAQSLRILGDANYLLGDYDSSIYYYHRAIGKFRLANNLKGLSVASNNLGVVFLGRSIYDSAIVYFDQSMKFKELLNDTLGLAYNHSNTGLIYLYQDKWEMAFNSFHKALEIYESLNSLPGIMDCYVNIGVVHHAMENYGEAFERFEQALLLAIQLDDKHTQAICLNNLGDHYFRTGEYQKAQELISEAYYIREELHDKSGMITSLINLSKLYEKNENFQRANEIYIQALEIANDLEELIQVADIFNSICFNLRIQGNVHEALPYAKKSIEIARQINAPTQILKNLKELTFIHAGLNMQDSAEKYFREYLKLHDELKREIGFYQTKVPDAAKKDIKTEQSDNLRNTLHITWIIFIIIISGLIIFIYLQFGMLITRHKQRRKFFRNRSK
jgi:tetratricopeptide (TPR) repeat protein